VKGSRGVWRVLQPMCIDREARYGRQTSSQPWPYSLFENKISELLKRDRASEAATGSERRELLSPIAKYLFT
jgi:hypothetical protein